MSSPYITPIFVKALAENPAVVALVGQQVYGGVDYPEGATLPLIIIDFQGDVLATPPAPAAWQSEGTLKILADTDAKAEQVLGVAASVCAGLAHTSHPGVALGTIDVAWTVLRTVDASWSPPRPQRIATVTAMARNR